MEKPGEGRLETDGASQGTQRREYVSLANKGTSTNTSQESQGTEAETAAGQTAGQAGAAPTHAGPHGRDPPLRVEQVCCAAWLSGEP